MPPESVRPTEPASTSATAASFGELLARGIARGGWLLGEALAGRPITMCTSSVCQWASCEHYYGPGCRPEAVDATVYSWGLCYVSVCALTVEEALRAANFEHPTGLDHGWMLADEAFRTGEPNGVTCPDDPNKRHWLFSC